MHRPLRCTPPGRVGRVAIHPVLGDIDVKAAEIDGAEMIDTVINLVELESRIRVPAFGGDMIEPIKNPAVD